jgi:hypothetical protein
MFSALCEKYIFLDMLSALYFAECHPRTFVIATQPFSSFLLFRRWKWMRRMEIWNYSSRPVGVNNIIKVDWKIQFGWGLAFYLFRAPINWYSAINTHREAPPLDIGKMLFIQPFGIGIIHNPSNFIEREVTSMPIISVSDAFANLFISTFIKCELKIFKIAIVFTSATCCNVRCHRRGENFCVH